MSAKSVIPDDPEIAELSAAIRKSWSHSTSNDPRWTQQSPSVGQCAVTALVVQDERGGKLLRAIVEGISHYWNLLPDGREVDLTRDQFQEFNPKEVIERDRDYVLAYPDTEARYEMLRIGVDKTLGRIKPSSHR